MAKKRGRPKGSKNKVKQREPFRAGLASAAAAKLAKQKPKKPKKPKHTPPSTSARP